MIALVGLGNQLIDLAVGHLRENAVAFADGQQDGIEHHVDATNDLRISTLELFRLASVAQLSFPRSIGEPSQLLLKALKYQSDVVDCLLHLFVIALVGLGNQLIDLAVGHLRENAVAFADGQQDGIEHHVDATYNLGIRAVKLFRLATF